METPSETGAGIFSLTQEEETLRKEIANFERKLVAFGLFVLSDARTEMIKAGPSYSAHGEMALKDVYHADISNFENWYNGLSEESGKNHSETPPPAL